VLSIHSSLQGINLSSLSWVICNIFFISSCFPQNQLKHVLKALFEGLTSSGEAFVMMDTSNLLAVKLFTEPMERPVPMQEYDVPMMLKV
jgi:hypothetical protein